MMILFCIQYYIRVGHQLQQRVQIMIEVEKTRKSAQDVRALAKRIKSMSQLNNAFVQYIEQIHQYYDTGTKRYEKQSRIFYQSLEKKANYEAGRIQPIKSLLTSYANLFCLISKISSFRLHALDKINTSIDKQEQKIVDKKQKFCMQMEDYLKNEQTSNQKYAEYLRNCDNLTKIMQKFKSYQDPINFYNLQMTSDYQKKLEKQINLCQNTEASLITHLQLLDQRRMLLSQNLKEVKEQNFILLHSHMQYFVDLTLGFTDLNKYDHFKLSTISSETYGDDERFSSESEKYEQKKIQKFFLQEQQLLHSIERLSECSEDNIFISSDYKLLLEKCQKFQKHKQKKANQSLIIKVQVLKQMQKQVQICDIFEKDITNIEKNTLKKLREFRDKIFKNFGDQMLRIIDFVLYLCKDPLIRLQKVKKIFESQSDRLLKIVHEQEEQIKGLKKKFSLIVSQHSTARKTMVIPGKMKIANGKNFNSSISKSFQNIKKIIQEFNANMSIINGTFGKILEKMNALLQKQILHSYPKHILEKKSQLIRTIKTLNVDSVVVKTVSNIEDYEVLFGESLAQKLFESFRSSINKLQYEETDHLLKKKQYQDQQLMGKRVIGCCGSQRRKVSDLNILSEHFVSLIDSEEKKRDGNLKILEKGIYYQEKNKNPFHSKVRMMISNNQILAFSRKMFSMKPGVQILTKMGVIVFLTSEEGTIEENLNKNIGKKLLSKQNDQSNNNSSSFFRNNTSSTFKISYQNSLASRDNAFKKNEDISEMLKQISKSWRTKKFLTDHFEPIQNHNYERNSRTDYIYTNDLSHFLLKQKKDGKASLSSRYIFLNYQWKVTFPQFPMLKSFRHSENIRIELTSQKVKVIIVEKQHQNSHLFMNRKFYQQIQIMNKRLSDFIVQFCQREGEIIIQQEKKQQSQISYNPQEGKSIKGNEQKLISPKSRTNESQQQFFHEKRK